MTNGEFLTTLADDLERLPTLITADRVARLRNLALYVDSLEQQASDYSLEELYDGPHRSEFDLDLK